MFKLIIFNHKKLEKLSVGEAVFGGKRVFDLELGLGNVFRVEDVFLDFLELEVRKQKLLLLLLRRTYFLLLQVV